MAKVEEDREASRSSYSSQTAREQNWGPANYRNEYGHTQYWRSGGDWAYLDGRWRETRDPSIEEAAIIEGEAQKLGFREFAEYPYVEILTYKPKYVEFLTDVGKRDHIDMKKFPEWVKYGDFGVTADSETGAADRKKNAKTISTVRGEFGFLIISAVYKECNHFEEGYRWVICAYYVVRKPLQSEIPVCETCIG